MKIIVNGAKGFMGKLTCLETIKRGHEVVAEVDAFGDGALKSIKDFKGKADMIIDFSNHLACKEVCDYAVANSVPAIIATTGHTEEEKAYILEASKKVAIFYSANMSLGVALLADLAKKAAKVFPDADIEIVEQHHNRKLDAPSGTALLLADKIKEERKNADVVCGRAGKKKREKGEIGIASLRLANVVGIHEVIVATSSQTITLKHEAHNRELFSEGALVAAEFLLGKDPGVYDIFSMTL